MSRLQLGNWADREEIRDCLYRYARSIPFRLDKVDVFVKSPETVMPDLIRHPKAYVITGFLLSQE